MQSDSDPLFSTERDILQEKDHNIQMVVTTPPSAGLQHPLLLGPNNTVTMCPFCRTSIKTTIEHKVTSRTHIAAMACCVMCCCCIPYCANSAKNTDHYCPSCQKYLGTYEK